MLGPHITPNTENVTKILKPEKLFSSMSKEELKAGDTIEISPDSITTTQDIMSIVELSQGASLIVDYGEDHAFS